MEEMKLSKSSMQRISSDPASSAGCNASERRTSLENGNERADRLGALGRPMPRSWTNEADCGLSGVVAATRLHRNNTEHVKPHE